MPNYVIVECDYWASFEPSQMGLNSVASSLRVMGFGEVPLIL